MQDIPNNSVKRRGGIEYKWIALSNTTLSIMLAFINTTSVMLALPVISVVSASIRWLQAAAIICYGCSWATCWSRLYLSSLLVVWETCSGGPACIISGLPLLRWVRFYVRFTWSHGSAGAIELILFRVVQGIGGAFLFANSPAILTDAFPENQRGMALGLNQVAGIGGSFLGILVGGLLSQANWRWVFLFNVPIGLLATIWAYRTLREVGTRQKEPIDWLGNLTFAAGLTMLLVALIYGINPSAHSLMSWTTPFVLSMLIGGVILLAAFIIIEQRVKAPMFRLDLFRIRAFAAGNIATLMSSLARGGFMLMLTIWLQGIWLPLHGYDFQVTPLWAGIYMIPSSVGILLLGPLSGRLSDRYGARYFATIAMILTAVAFSCCCSCRLILNTRYLPPSSFSMVCPWACLWHPTRQLS